MNRTWILASLAFLAVVPNPTCEQPQLRITPTGVSLSAGQRQQFTAELRDGSPAEPSWYLFHGPGIVSRSGLYKAPYHVRHESVATLRAHLERENPDRNRQAIVEVVLRPGSFVGADSCCSGTQGEIPEPLTDIPLDTEPEPVMTPIPAYPKRAIELGAEGRVVIGALVCRSGEVLDTWFLESIPELEETVDRAIRRWQFEPAMLEGDARAAWITIPFRFTLADSSVAIDRAAMAAAS